MSHKYSKPKKSQLSTEAEGARPEKGGEPVGYKKPPKHTQFKKGHSGNPKGKPKKVKTSLEVFSAFIHTPLPFPQDGKMAKLTPMEVHPKILFKGFVQGKTKQTEIFLKKLAEVEAIAEKATSNPPQFSWGEQDARLLRWLETTPLTNPEDRIGGTQDMKSGDTPQDPGALKTDNDEAN